MKDVTVFVTGACYNTHKKYGSHDLSLMSHGFASRNHNRDWRNSTGVIFRAKEKRYEPDHEQVEKIVDVCLGCRHDAVSADCGSFRG